MLSPAAGKARRKYKKTHWVKVRMNERSERCAYKPSGESFLLVFFFCLFSSGSVLGRSGSWEGLRFKVETVIEMLLLRLLRLSLCFLVTNKEGDRRRGKVCYTKMEDIGLNICRRGPLCFYGNRYACSSCCGRQEVPVSKRVDTVE